MTLANTTVEIDTGAFVGSYGGALLGPGSVTGDQSIVVIPDMRWGVTNFTDPQGISFDVDTAGNVTPVDTDRALASGSTLSFKNTTIQIDVGEYIGAYTGAMFGPIGVSGDHEVVVVPDMLWGIANGSDPQGVIFSVSDLGIVVSLDPVEANGVNSVLALENILVSIDPTTFTGNYQTAGLILTGQSVITLIPGLLNTIGINGVGVGSYEALVAGVTPASFVANVAGDDHTFLFSIVSTVAEPQTLSLMLAGLLAASRRRPWPAILWSSPRGTTI